MIQYVVTSMTSNSIIDNIHGGNEMIFEILENIKGKLSIEFFANVSEAQKFLKEEMKKRNETDELKFVMEHAASSEKDKNLRTLCIYSLCFYYKYYRIGIFYVQMYSIEDEIEKIELSEESEIRVLLEEGARSDDKNINFWAKLALEPMSKGYS